MHVYTLPKAVFVTQNVMKHHIDAQKFLGNNAIIAWIEGCLKPDMVCTATLTV